jgi:hypothetical protein
MNRGSSGQAANYHILGQAGTSFLTAVVWWLRKELKASTKYTQGVVEMSKKGQDDLIKEDEISTACTQLWSESLNTRDHSEYLGTYRIILKWISNKWGLRTYTYTLHTQNLVHWTTGCLMLSLRSTKYA